jgi:hypothetical protein
MNLAWTFGDFVSPKLHRPDLAKVSYHWAGASSKAAIAIEYAKVSAVHIMLPSPKRQARLPGASKTSGDFADPPAVCCGSLNALD